MKQTESVNRSGLQQDRLQAGNEPEEIEIVIRDRDPLEPDGDDITVRIGGPATSEHTSEPLDLCDCLVLVHLTNPPPRRSSPMRKGRSENASLTVRSSLDFPNRIPSSMTLSATHLTHPTAAAVPVLYLVL